MKCYELKNCCFKGIDPKEAKCQPYQLQIGCWEFDWESLYKAMPDCDDKFEWRDIMLNSCPNCEVYKFHKSEIDRILEGLKE